MLRLLWSRSKGTHRKTWNVIASGRSFSDFEIDCPLQHTTKSRSLKFAFLLTHNAHRSYTFLIAKQLPFCRQIRPRMSQFLVQFAQAHNDFRLPELQSIAELHGITYTMPEKEEDKDPYRPWMVIGLASEDDARTLARRCILIKYVLDTAAFKNVRRTNRLL